MGRKERWGRPHVHKDQPPYACKFHWSLVITLWDRIITILNRRKEILGQVDIDNLYAWAQPLPTDFSTRTYQLASVDRPSHNLHLSVWSPNTNPRIPVVMLSILGPQMPGVFMTLKTNNVPWTLGFPIWLLFCRWQKQTAVFSCTWPQLFHPWWYLVRKCTPAAHSNYKRGMKERCFLKANPGENVEIKSKFQKVWKFKPLISTAELVSLLW